MTKKSSPEPWYSLQPPGSANQLQRPAPWKTPEQEVARLQHQIAQASQREDREGVHRRQQRLLELEAARLLAVRRVAEENHGRHTAGVDGVKSLTASERIAMVDAIHPRNWPQQPCAPARRVWIPKPGTTEQRPLAILPMIDRCKQALVKMALEPEWEERFEPQSYGYRPGRGTRDAMRAILGALENQSAFVFNADIEKAFDEINQTVILEKLQTFPFLREAIASWLRAGVREHGLTFPTDRGIPQGGTLSPLLLNVALHGMAAVVAHNVAGDSPLLVRYADNFAIVHADLDVLQQAVRRIKPWLASMGLHLNTRKTHLAHTLTPHHGLVGFEFLGFHISQEAPENRPSSQSSLIRTMVLPGEEAKKRHQLAIEQRLHLIQAAPQAQVIAELNPLILGWTAYYQGLVAPSVMSHYDELLEKRLLAWAESRHPGKARDWLLARYWPQDGQQSRIFATPDGVQLRAYQGMDRPSKGRRFGNQQVISWPERGEP